MAVKGPKKFTTEELQKLQDLQNNIKIMFLFYIVYIFK